MMQTTPKTPDRPAGEEYDPAIAALRDAAGMAGALARKLERGGFKNQVQRLM
jgi:hypothetical protein